MKFSGKNFQPWPDFDLEINGLTIVIGPSNEGKSAIYRALRGLLRNKIEESQIRNPKDAPLELCLEHAGHTIKAARSKKGVTYEIDGLKYAKLDGSVPEIVKELKFGEVRIGDFTFDPIFASQNRPQFLIDDEAFKPSEINAILGAFGGTERLEHGKKQANLQKTQRDGEAKVLAAQIRDAEDRKARLADMNVRGRSVSDNLHALEGVLRTLESETYWCEQVLQRRRRIAPLRQILDLLVLPDISEIERLQQVVFYAEQAAESSAFARWLGKPLLALDTVTASWSATVALWKQVRALDDAADAASSQIDTSGLVVIADLPTKLKGVTALQSSITHIENVLVLRGQLKELTGQLADIEQKLSVAQEEARKGLCEKCGKPREHICQ